MALVVAFKGWRTVAALKARVRRALSGVIQPHAWRVRARPRRVRGHPTDFLVLEVQHNVPAVRDALLAHRHVASVTQEHTYRATTRRSSQGGRATSRRPSARQLELGGSAAEGAVRRDGMAHSFVTTALDAPRWWRGGVSGRGIRVAIMDTGLRGNQTFVRNVEDVVDFTQEHITDDRVGHSSFMAGVIASQHDCLGFAPDASLFMLRVFDSNQGSSTSSFLEAFNYALLHQVDLINLSVGGPDYRDLPFVAKVRQVAMAGITIASGAGNSGPSWGSVLNPADEGAVIGVGGLTETGTLAPWSARGISVQEHPYGAGRMTVDITTFGEFWGMSSDGSCAHQWGTSVACPVVVGVMALLLSSVGEARRAQLRNPAAMKQVITQSARRLDAPSFLEQGMGALQPEKAGRLVAAFSPHVSSLPPSLDLTDCPYMSPYCEQPLYHTARPVSLNLTILNSRCAVSRIRGRPRWIPEANGFALEVSFSTGGDIAPWVGFLGVRLVVPPAAAAWSGKVVGHIEVTLDDLPMQAASPAAPVHSRRRHAANGTEQTLSITGLLRLARALPGGAGGSAWRSSRCPGGGGSGVVRVPLAVEVVPTPPRRQRLLFDTFHSSAFPNGFFPNDDLEQQSLEMMDWHGDHLYNNYRSMHLALRRRGFFVEVLNDALTNFNATHYGAVILADPEEPFMRREMRKLNRDVNERGLNLVAIADWYNARAMLSLAYYDDAKKEKLQCSSGGANVPSLNQLLRPFGVGFASSIYHGNYQVGARTIAHNSGSAIDTFPAGGQLLTVPLKYIKPDTVTSKQATQNARTVLASPLGFVQLSAPQAGWLLAMGDSSCLDDSSPNYMWPAKFSCVSLLVETLGFLQLERPHSNVPKYVSGGKTRPLRLPILGDARLLTEPLEPHPRSLDDTQLTQEQVDALNSHSRVLGILKRCQPGNQSCHLPLVSAPLWREGTGGDNLITERSHFGALANYDLFLRRRAAVNLANDPLPLELLMPLPAGFFIVAAALSCLIYRRKRKTQRQRSSAMLVPV
ncbi:hypothetical protein AB1Y20_022008 [Prymnesium parvum]|uniref:Subtilisin n=1 Tax=Prymnesium parvum TaxID=97485 RepID=A0AB34JEX0_PRYPA